MIVDIKAIAARYGVSVRCFYRWRTGKFTYIQSGEKRTIAFTPPPVHQVLINKNQVRKYLFDTDAVDSWIGKRFPERVKDGWYKHNGVYVYLGKSST